MACRTFSWWPILSLTVPILLDMQMLTVGALEPKKPVPTPHRPHVPPVARRATCAQSQQCARRREGATGRRQVASALARPTRPDHLRFTFFAGSFNITTKEKDQKSARPDQSDIGPSTALILSRFTKNNLLEGKRIIQCRVFNCVFEPGRGTCL